MSGRLDLYHSHRGMFSLCSFWIRDERTSVGDLNQFVLQNKPAGSFYARPSNSFSNTKNEVNNVFMFDKYNVVLESNDDLDGIKKGCVVLYNGKPWLVDNVQQELHQKESEFNQELDFKWYISLTR